MQEKKISQFAMMTNQFFSHHCVACLSIKYFRNQKKCAFSTIAIM